MSLWVTVMRCYFLRGGQIAGVNMLPRGLSDQDALGKAETQSFKRRGPVDGLEVWDRARLIFRRLGPIGPGRWTIVQGWESAEDAQSPAARESPLEGGTDAVAALFARGIDDQAFFTRPS
jgi:hypothetical protein